MGKLINRARMTVASAPGTGVIALGSAPTGHQTFAAAGIADGDVISYTAESGYSNGVPTVWEYGQGTYAASGPTLTRTTVQGGTSGTSAVSLGADAQVFVSPLAADIGPTLGAAVATTSGVSVDFTGIPASTKRLTLHLVGVSTAGTSPLLLQLGSGSVQVSGYAGGYFANTSYRNVLSAGFQIQGVEAASTLCYGTIILTRIGNTNTWSAVGCIMDMTYSLAATLVNGVVTLGGPIDRARLTTVAGSDAFDAGSASLTLEG